MAVSFAIVGVYGEGGWAPQGGEGSYNCGTVGMILFYLESIPLHKTPHATRPFMRLASRCHLFLLLSLLLLLLYGFRKGELWIFFIQTVYSDVLHPYLAGGGRLGNKVFEDLAISALSQRYDTLAYYEYEAELGALGIPLYTKGSKRMHQSGKDVVLTDALLRRLLTSFTHHDLPSRIQVHGYYQTPWFADYIRSQIFRCPPGSLSIPLANPWRSRFDANNDTFIHVRLGDTLTLYPGATRSAQAYIGAVGGRGMDALLPLRGEVYIASDTPTHPIVTHLASHFSAIVLDLEPVQTIQFGCTCRNIVISDGTFSWLIGALASPQARVAVVDRGIPWVGNITLPDWERY